MKTLKDELDDDRVDALLTDHQVTDANLLTDLNRLKHAIMFYKWAM